jgi:hypothetical protein
MQLPVPGISGEKVADAIMGHLEVEPGEEEPDSRKDPGSSGGEWRYEENRGKLYIAGGGMGIRLNLSNGSLELLDFGKGNMLAEPVQPDFFRAPTDNEQKGLAAFLDEFLPAGLIGRGFRDFLYRRADRIYGKSWDDAGAGRILKSWKVKQTSEGLKLGMKLKVSGFFGFLYQEFFFSNSAVVRVRMSGLPRREMVRFGTRMALPSRYRQVSWYGRGPQECYIDRSAGAMVGVYEADADELSFDYLHPQESGNRTDVRRVSFSDGGAALTFSAPEGGSLDFSARFASREAVAAAGHPHEITRSENLHVHIDGGQRGVGGSIPGLLHLMGKYRMKPFRLYRMEYAISRETPGGRGQ